MNLPRFIAVGFGSGLTPWAPGTAGSLVGAALGAAALLWAPQALPLLAVAATAAGCLTIPAVTGLSWRAAAKRETDDPSWIVIDEIAGQLCAMCFLPGPTWPGIALSFMLFRLLDITKPWPISWLDRQGGTFGIMADDLAAGLVAGGLVGASFHLV